MINRAHLPKTGLDFKRSVKPDVNCFKANPTMLKRLYVANILRILAECIEGQVIESFSLNWKGRYDLIGEAQFKEEDEPADITINFKRRQD